MLPFRDVAEAAQEHVYQQPRPDLPLDRVLAVADEATENAAVAGVRLRRLQLDVPFPSHDAEHAAHRKRTEEHEVGVRPVRDKYVLAL